MKKRKPKPPREFPAERRDAVLKRIKEITGVSNISEGFAEVGFLVGITQLEKLVDAVDAPLFARRKNA